MLRITVAAVARNFDIFAPKDTSETTMEIKDSFVSGGIRLVLTTIDKRLSQIILPASMKCKLIFSPRKL